MSKKAAQPVGPTLDELRGWPASVSVEDAALALGVSRAHAYACIKTGTFPARALRVGTRTKIVTSSIIAALEGAAS
jgi:predicted DNA-binding transcriptional regulator AlpA